MHISQNILVPVVLLKDTVFTKANSVCNSHSPLCQIVAHVFPVNLDENENGSPSIDEGTGSFEDADSHALYGLLPDDENELLAGIMEDFDLSGLPSSLENLEDDDIFGGIELEMDPQENLAQNISKMSLSGNSSVPQYGFSNGTGTVSGEHPYGEHPSRTLFVRNINSNVEDSELRSLFEIARRLIWLGRLNFGLLVQQYGDIRTMYTACKHRGFVMISYYDIRGARTAMRALQNKPLRRRKLDIHFSIPKENPTDKDINQGTLVVFNLDLSVSNEQLLKIFGCYGEVKEIRETPQKRHHKFIEYYDVRHAEAALKSLNGCDIAGKRIKLEPSRPGGARRSLMFQLNQDLEQDDSRSFRPHQVGSPITSSPPGNWMQLSSPMEHRPMMNIGQISDFKGNGPSYNGHIPGLASILHPQMSSSLKIAPIGKKQGIGNNGFQHAHSLPVPKLSEHFGSVSSTGLSTSNGSLETLSGPQFLWGGSKPYFESPASSSPWATPPMRHQFMHEEKAPNASLSGQLGPFLSSSSHHVGSAPPGYPLQRQFSSFPESPEASFMRPPPFQMNLNSRGAPGSLFENRLTNFPVISPPGLSPVFMGGVGPYPPFGTNGMDGLDEHIRAHRNESGRIEVDSIRKQFQLDLSKIISGEDTRTTLMIKNIPNKYTSKMLLASIDENHQGTYDFLYLPIDFKNKCNVGYAFINMKSPAHIIPFYEHFNGKRWEKFNSEKVASLAYARIQGKAALVAHFQNSSLMNEDKRCRPILFQSEGPEAIDQDIFVSSANVQIHWPIKSEPSDPPANLAGEKPDKISTGLNFPR
ncbi:protein MEI2-like 5 isoform X1 [Punica granatum]|uniref:Protein MEI2-like 5 isoform X1 n=1 Tax=Punica granatum TaxID=22663 RepID=A0A6P8DEC2_PUNGR|nr:protein MEI2-like 5 isoform X1 [Punica granatum]